MSFRFRCILVYEICTTASSPTTPSLLPRQTISLASELWDFQLAQDGALWTVERGEEDEVGKMRVYRCSQEEEDVRFVEDEEMAAKLGSTKVAELMEGRFESISQLIYCLLLFKMRFLDCKGCSDNVEELYKHWFDNVKEYMERKEERMSQKKAKRE